MSAEHIQAMRAGLAAQVTTYDEGGLRLHVTRREARVDVAFETVTPEGAVRRSWSRAGPWSAPSRAR